MSPASSARLHGQAAAVLGEPRRGGLGAFQHDDRVGRIYADPDNRPLQDALWFFERWLPGVLARLGQAVRCDVAGCRLTRSSPWERSPPRYT